MTTDFKMSDDTRNLRGFFASKSYLTKLDNLRGRHKERKKIVEEKEVRGDDYTSDWREGRRVVELGHLADMLKECKNCKSALLLHNCTSERRYGLGSILYVKCQNCPHINQISTGKRHRAENSTRGMQIWDVNTKLSMGMKFKKKTTKSCL